MTKTKRNLDEWLEMVNNQRASGMTQKAWCEANGINRSTMADRVSRLRKKGLITEPKPNCGGRSRQGKPSIVSEAAQRSTVVQWAEIPASTPINAPPQSEIRLCRGGWEVVIAAKFDAKHLAAVMRVVDSVCC